MKIKLISVLLCILFSCQMQLFSQKPRAENDVVNALADLGAKYLLLSMDDAEVKMQESAEELFSIGTPFDAVRKRLVLSSDETFVVHWVKGNDIWIPILERRLLGGLVQEGLTLKLLFNEERELAEIKVTKWIDGL